jgi:predicted RNase H-like HicB family nuclease
MALRIWAALILGKIAIPLFRSETSPMSGEFTAIIERDGDWYIAYCAEIPGANGQGRTKEEARESLVQAIKLVLEDRRADALRGLPSEAVRETVTVK